MDFFHTATLALIQGVTEFLPVSSSAHLLLPHHVLGWPDQGLAFDTAVHCGSLIAVLVYFRSEITRLVMALWRSASTRQSSEDSQFALLLVVASLPVLVVGFFGRTTVEDHLRGLEVIVTTTIVFALLLWAADLFGIRKQESRQLSLTGALIIGLSQCLALVPGTSRSGITMTAALFLGYTRTDASRISFLIAIPAIAGACTLKMYDLISGEASVDWLAIAVGGGLSAVSAYFCISLFIGLIERIGFLPFILYRLALGGLLYLLLLT